MAGLPLGHIEDGSNFVSIQQNRAVTRDDATQFAKLGGAPGRSALLFAGTLMRQDRHGSLFCGVSISAADMMIASTGP